VMTLNIHQRINKVREAVAYLKKDKRVESYLAVEHDAVTAEVRPHLIKHGINMIVRQLEGEVQETGKATSKGNPITRYVAFYEIDWVNVDDPEDRETTSIGSIAEDHGDKAPGKCVSYAVKAITLKTFNIETGESDESRVESTERINEKQVSTILDLINEKQVDEVKFNQWMSVDKIESVLAKDYQKAVSALQAKKTPREPGEEG